MNEKGLEFFLSKNPRFPAISGCFRALRKSACRSSHCVRQAILGPFSTLKTGNGNARATILPQSLQPRDAVVHPRLILADTRHGCTGVQSAAIADNPATTIKQFRKLFVMKNHPAAKLPTVIA
jgi:hypothetical protein